MRTATDVGEFRARNADLPLKNRVWGFRTPARHRARRSASQVPKSRRENAATATTTASGRWVFLQTDPIPPRPAEMNAYVYVRNNPVTLTDPRGRDVWVEGPSGTEPPGHQSICVGKPGGHYLSVSFALNLSNPFAWNNGRIYVDEQHGGEIVRTLDTTLQEDLYALQILTEMLADPNGHYNIWNGTCRDFSNAMFDHFEDILGSGEKK